MQRSKFSGVDMKRREFVTALGGAVAWPLAARAQRSSRMKRIALVKPAGKIGDMGADSPVYRVFFEELSRLGYVEGQNLVVERYSGEGRTERYADLAREVVNTHPDLIFSETTRLALNFKAATTTIPIVTTTADPIAAGLVSSLARPGGNITGVSQCLGRALDHLQHTSRCAITVCTGMPEDSYAGELRRDLTEQL